MTRSSLLRFLCLLAVLVPVGVSAAQADQGLVVKVTLGQAPPKMVTAPPGQNASPGTTALYLFRLQNTSSATQSYQLSATSSPSWKTSLPQSKSGKAGPLAPGQSLTIAVALTIPRKTPIGTTCATTLTATTVGRPRATDRDTVLTTVVSPSGLSLRMEAARTARRGEVVSYHATLTNAAAGPQRVGVTGVSVSGWQVRITGVAADGLTLAPGKAAEFTVDVTVPKDAPAAAAEALVVTAQPYGALTEHVQTVSKITVQ